MDLKSENPFWLLKNGLLRSYPFLENDLTCDVAILGGGITGAPIAESLVTAGLQCVVLDRRDIGTGSTAATTALLQYEIDTHLVDLIETMGLPGAERAYRLCHDSIHELATLVDELPDRCGFRKKHSLYLGNEKRDAAQLQLECEARRSAGIAVEYLTAGEVQSRFGLEASAALLSSTAAQVDAYRLTHRLFERNAQRGLLVFDRTEAVEVRLILIRYWPNRYLPRLNNNTVIIAPVRTSRHVNRTSGSALWKRLIGVAGSLRLLIRCPFLRPALFVHRSRRDLLGRAFRLSNLLFTLLDMLILSFIHISPLGHEENSFSKAQRIAASDQHRTRRVRRQIMFAEVYYSSRSG